jgi:hypothetical protein
MIAIAVLAAQYAGTLDLLGTARVDARLSDPLNLVEVSNRTEQIVIAGDAFLTATGRLHVSDRRWDYTLTYSPSFTAPDLELEFDSVPAGTTTPTSIQAATASIAWHDRFASVIVSESASYGALSTALPYQAQGTAAGQTATAAPAMTPGQTMSAGQTAATGQTTLLSAEKTVPFGSSNTSATLTLRPERRTTVTVTGGYVSSGGLDPKARSVLPEQFGPSASASVGYATTPADRLFTVASAQDTTTVGPCPPPLFGPPPPGPPFCRTETPIAQIEETLRHQLSSAANLSVGAGLAVSVVQALVTSTLVTPTQVQDRNLAILPVAGVTYSQQLNPTGTHSLLLSSQLGPNVDLFTGLLSERLQTLAALTDQVAPMVTLALTAGVLRSLPFPTTSYALTIVSAGAEARIYLTKQLDLLLGEQNVWQYEVGYPSPVVSLVGYAGVTARAPTLHF